MKAPKDRTCNFRPFQQRDILHSATT
jgi:hypothetical protein